MNGFWTSKKNAMKLVEAVNSGEPCRVCGQEITGESVYAGYSVDNKSRRAHKECWNANLPKTQWAYPVDAEA